MDNIREKIFFVQLYISLTKNVEVDIALPGSAREVLLLGRASDIAKSWLKKSQVKITPLI